MANRRIGKKESKSINLRLPGEWIDLLEKAYELKTKEDPTGGWTVSMVIRKALHEGLLSLQQELMEKGILGEKIDGTE